MLVVDSSALQEVLLNTPAASRVADRLFATGETLHAPHMIDLEVAQVLRRYSATGAISPARGSEALNDMENLVLTRYPHAVLLGRIWELREYVTAYDAAYLALAEALAVPLVTRDAVLARAAKRIARIEVI